MAVTESPGDPTLMRAVKRGDRNALAMLYDRHATAMLTIAESILREPAEAEDLVHDVFIDTWNRPQAYDQARGSVGAWLRMRTRSRSIDRLRAKVTARKYAVAAGLQQHIRKPSAHGDPSLGMAQQQLSEALEHLSHPVRKVIQLTYLEGYTCGELARDMNVPLGTIKSRLARGMEQLRRHLVDEQELG
ncbi:MAG: sigma-70 family RNA polymerase sigma factor [Myxococcales bacterium]|nr:sigma-70 family RNA polymerase sigma factor [Myxococcales bacterium]MDD9970844.1 sigma-70 family RNA polymerase sigma factor [Myxococcales bacterium]